MFFADSKDIKCRPFWLIFSSICSIESVIFKPRILGSLGSNTFRFLRLSRVIVLQGMRNFSKQARELLIAIQKIDSANYPEVSSASKNWMDMWVVLHTFCSLNPQSLNKNHSCCGWQTLHRMFIINAGTGFKILWNTIRGFLDNKTTSKINVSLTQSHAFLILYSTAISKPKIDE